jgi:hypothetical protein
MLISRPSRQGILATMTHESRVTSHLARTSRGVSTGRHHPRPQRGGFGAYSALFGELKLVPNAISLGMSSAFIDLTTGFEGKDKDGKLMCFEMIMLAASKSISSR